MNEVNNDFIADVSCCGYSVGDTVNTPYGIGEVWKTTKESVHVRIENVGQHGKNHHDYFYSKYLVNPTHHMQSGLDKISHCS